jgi:hypothetical protein
MNQEGADDYLNHPSRVADADAYAPSPIEDDGWVLNDALRRWALKTFGPNLDLDYATAQFLDHFIGNRSRRPNWNTEWQKWIRREAKYVAERRERGNVVQLPTGQTLTGTDAKVAGWMALAEQLRQEGDPA